MITLTVVVDEMLDERRPGVARYAGELTRALVDGAPKDCEVRGLVAASPEADYVRIAERIPGLAGLDKSAFARRELRAAWQRGLGRVAPGSLVHAPSLFAPLRRHDRINEGTQLSATIHDATAWTAPELLRGREAAWQRAMGERARRHADAIVVPSHAVAEVLAEELGVGDRLRVIAGAPSRAIATPEDADERAEALGLPERFVLGVGSLDRRAGLDRLLAAMALPDAPEVPVVIVGASTERTAEAAAAAGLAEERLVALGRIEDEDLGTVLGRATALAVPSRAEGFGLTMLEAMALGTPVVHADIPALAEIAAGSCLAVALDDDLEPAEALAAALREVVDDASRARELAITGGDRATAYTWRGAAEQVWRLHADL